jgi:hypothetical protein
MDELANNIATLFEEATHNPCTCNIDENSCPYCGAWTKAIRNTRELIDEYISTVL